jgi:hypothetical protein
LASFFSNIFVGAFPKLRNEYQLFTNQISKDVANGHIQGVVFVHLCNGPCPLLPVPSHHGALVAGLAQGHACVVVALLDMVGV